MSSATIVNNLSVQFIRYAPIPVFILGCIGNIFNILIFTRPQLNKNPCSTYFFYASIANINVLLFGVVTRFLSDGFGIDPVSNNLEFCRFRYFVLHGFLVLSSWFTILAGIDRYCISSQNVHRRQLSNLRYSRYLVGLTTLIVAVLYSHIFGLFTIEQLKSGPYCYAQAGAYRVFYDFLYFATFSFTPPIVMIIFGLATFYNVRRTQLQIVPTATTDGNISQLKRRDQQLIRMALVQFICTVVLTLPAGIQKLYATFTQNVAKDAYQLALENFLTQVLRVFVFINSSASFYIFTLSGSLYRKEFLQMMSNVIGCIFGKNSAAYRQFLPFIQVNGQTVEINPTRRTAER